MQNIDEKVIDVKFEEVKDTECKKESVMDKIKSFGSKGLDKVKKGIEYAKNNPDELVEKTVGVVSTAVIIGCTVAGINDCKKIGRTVYSEDIGETVELKKKLTNDEKIELDYRMKTGQTKIEALRSMDKIKTKK